MCLHMVVRYIEQPPPLRAHGFEHAPGDMRAVEFRIGQGCLVLAPIVLRLGAAGDQTRVAETLHMLAQNAAAEPARAAMHHEIGLLCVKQSVLVHLVHGLKFGEVVAATYRAQALA